MKWRTRKQWRPPALGDRRVRTRFAWWPVKFDSGLTHWGVMYKVTQRWTHDEHGYGWRVIRRFFR